MNAIWMIIAAFMMSAPATAQWRYPTAGIPRTPDGKPNLSEPWTVTLPLTFQADDELMEYICNENNKYFGLEIK